MLRTSAVTVALTALASPSAALADASDADALRVQLVQPANDAIRAKLAAQKAARQLSQANPVGTPQRPLRRPGLPPGLTYNVDFSIAAPVSNPGFNAKNRGLGAR